jgi:hypothetical protein
METVALTNQSPVNVFKMETSEPLSPSKSLCVTIDLFDLVKPNKNYASSHVSTYDTNSTRTDDDTNKSVISESIITKASISLREQPESLDNKMTLKEIISRRCHQKKGMNTEKTTSKKDKTTKKDNKRKTEKNEIPIEEKIVKKEKLNNSEPLKIDQFLEDKILAPKIIIKDGKVQIDNSSILNQEIEPPRLEIVLEKKKITTSNSFKNINHSEKWTEEETKKFYRAIELFGTDFSLITKLFPNRNRNQIKNKFLKEEKVSKKKIDSIFKQNNPENLKKIYKKAYNYLMPSVQKPGDIEITNLILCNKDQASINTKRRSDSFNSTSSVDSLDMTIIQDLSDLLKQKSV